MSVGRGTAVGIGVLIVALVVLLTAGWATAPANGWGMMHYGYGAGPAWGIGMLFGLLWMVIFWALVAVAIVLVVRALGGGTAWSAPRGPERPLDILQRRYAAGEIDQATYERMKKELGG